MESFRKKLFTLRSYTPIPFLLVMLIFSDANMVSVMLGLIFIFIGELLRLWSVAYAGRLTRVTTNVGAPELIMAGPFSYVRNPIYLGNLLLYCGFGIMANALFPWLLVVAVLWFVFQYYQIVLLEEEFLKKNFKSLYSEYKNNVPRFIPRISRYQNEIQSKQLPNWKEAMKSERRTFQALGIVVLTLLIIWQVR